MSQNLTVIYLLLLTTIVNGVVFIQQQTSTNITMFLKQLLQTYKRFHVNFCVDKTTLDEISGIIFQGLDRTVQIYNVEVAHSNFVVRRPKVPHNFYLFYIKNETVWFNKFRTKVTHNDAILFVTIEQNVRSKLVEYEFNILRFAGKVLVLELSEQKLGLYKVCYYCGRLSRQIVPIKIQDLQNEALETFQDLNGHLLRLVFLNFYPYIYCVSNYSFPIQDMDVQICLKFDGVESHMIRLISRKMNFQYMAYVNDKNTPIYNMLKFVNSSKADIAFGAISLSLDRIQLIQYTNQYAAQNFIFLYSSHMSFWKIFEQFLEPFQAIYGWILFLITFNLLAIVLYLVFKVHEKANQRKRSVLECFWILYRMPFEQPVPHLSSIFRGIPNVGLVLSLWWWCCLMFGTTYKSMVLSALVQPSNTEPENLAQLMNVNYQIFAVKRSGDLVKSLLNVSDPYYIKAQQNMVFGDSICEGFVKVSEDRVAMLDEQSTVQYGIGGTCPELRAKSKRHLRITRVPLNSVGHAWTTQIGAPYKQALDYYLGLILSGGLFLKWSRDVKESSEGESIILSREKVRESAAPLHLQSFQPLAVIYSSGICISIICFLLEQLHFKYNQQHSVFLD